jgi:prepilin-type N-terminal cleavage/methylation domain-containing protein
MTKSRRKSRGFSLVEIAMVLAILGFVLTIGLKSTGAYLSAERRQTTVARLAGIDAALVNYVAQQGRLPCPADGALATGVAGAGVEAITPATGACTAMTNGVAPWVTLGLPEGDALDGWDNRITYRTITATLAVPNIGFTSDQAMDMTHCDPAGGAAAVNLDANPALPLRLHNRRTCAPTTVAPAAGCNLPNVTVACTSPRNFVDGRGIAVREDLLPVGALLPCPAPPALPCLMNPTAAAALAPVSTGAAYVLISHGENRGGAFSRAGALQAASPANSAMENWNSNGQALQLYYVDAPLRDADDATHFDDIVLRPSLFSVITRAQLGPRAHLN